MHSHFKMTGMTLELFTNIEATLKHVVCCKRDILPFNLDLLSQTGVTPLHMACEMGSMEILRLMRLDIKDINLKNMKVRINWWEPVNANGMGHSTHFWKDVMEKQDCNFCKNNSSNHNSTLKHWTPLDCPPSDICVECQCCVNAWSVLLPLIPVRFGHVAILP